MRKSVDFKGGHGAPGETRTPDPLLRRQSIQPLPGIINLSHPWVSILPQVEEFLMIFE